MAHMVETMVSGEGLIPWHGLGKVKPGLLTAVEVIADAGIDWEVKKFPVYAEVEGQKIHAPDQFATVRMSDLKVLGVVGGRYEVIQNADALDWMDYVVGNGEAIYTSAGSLRHGQTVWIAAQVPSSSKSLDKPVNYFVSRTSHDGSTACEVYFTPIRPVCWNTLSAGVNGRSNCMKIRHTSSAKEKMDVAKVAVSHAHKYFETIDKLFDRMHEKKFTPKQLEELISKTFGFTVVKPDTPNRVIHRQDAIKDNIFNLAENGKGTDLPDVKGTAWGAYNAIAEYTDYEMKLNKLNGDEKARRFDANMFGRSADIKLEAFNNVLAMAKLAA